MNIKSIKKIAFLFSFSLVILSGCTPKEEDTVLEKKDFVIEIKHISDFSKKVTLTKPGKIVGSKEILVTSQVSGRVKTMYKDEWEKANAWEPILDLADDIANYKSQRDRAKNALDSAVTSYEQTNLTLKKVISDSKLGVEQAEHNLEVAQDSAEQTLKQAKQSLDRASLSQWGEARLALDKIITDLSNQIESLKASFSVQKSQIENLLSDVLRKSDTLLGISDKYRFGNDDFEEYLWAKDILKRNEAKKFLLELYQLQNSLAQISTIDVTNKDLKNSLVFFELAYAKIGKMLLFMQWVLEQSVSSPSFSQVTIDGHLSVYDGFDSALQGARSSFVGYKSQVNSLLVDVDVLSSSDQEQVNTLAQQQLKIAMKNAEFTESQSQIAYETAKINMENAIFNAETSLKNAKSAYQMSKDNIIKQLEILKNSTAQAKISYDDAQRQYKKLSIRAPIRGKIWTVYVDEWQEVGMGMKLFSIVSDREQFVELFVTSEEYQYIDVDQTVGAIYEEKLISGTIRTKSSVANQTTLYKVVVELKKDIKLVGDVATIYVPVKLKQKVLPVNVVTSLRNGHGFVYILNKSWALEKYTIELWKVRGDKVEILNKVPSSLDIVVTDVSNFDSQKFKLITVKEKKEKEDIENNEDTKEETENKKEKAEKAGTVEKKEKEKEEKKEVSEGTWTEKNVSEDLVDTEDTEKKEEKWIDSDILKDEDFSNLMRILENPDSVLDQ